ncbi:MAG: hypothetical protein IK079_02765, partial [Desulfovibrio sp.]|nr:hypothetical protein [Desulfovibrio sp.]
MSYLTSFRFFTPTSTVAEVMKEPSFARFAHLLFPMERVEAQMTLKEVSSSAVYLWYNYLNVEMT